MRVLRKRGVEVFTATKVQKIEPTRIYLDSGQTVDSATIVLAAGVGPNPLIEKLPLEKLRRRIAVEPTMRVKNNPHVWAIGDCAAIPDPDGKLYPQLAQHALREAKVLAKNMTAVIRAVQQERPEPALTPFIYKTLGTLAALGHYSGVGKVLAFKVKGFIAWWVWRTYYLMQMPRWSRRFRIMLDWTMSLFFKYDIVKLDFDTEPEPGERVRPVITVHKLPESELPRPLAPQASSTEAAQKV
jgi:NADH dehydrogenase